MFDQTPNLPPIEGFVNLGCEWTVTVEFVVEGLCMGK